MQTAQQKRAAKAYELVSKLDKNCHQEYGRLAHKLPLLILSNGLPSALEFLRTRKVNCSGAAKLESSLTAHFKDSGRLKGGDLLQEVLALNLVDFMAFTREALLISEWHKRFSVSILKIEPGQEDNAGVSK